MIAGTTPNPFRCHFHPIRHQSLLLKGKYGTSVRVYRVLLSGNVATVTLLATLAGRSQVPRTRLPT